MENLMRHLEGYVLIILSILISAAWMALLSKLCGMFLRKKENRAGVSIALSVCFLGLSAAAKAWAADNYMMSSAVQQTLLLLFLATTFHGDGWEKLGLSGVLVSLWVFLWNGLDSVFSICDIIFSNNKFLPYERGNGYLIAVLSFLTTAVCMYMLFGRTKLSEGNFLHGSGKILFCIAVLLLFLIDMCNFGITRGVGIVSDNGAEYWNITHNECLTHMEVIIISGLCLAVSLSLLFGMNSLIEYITMNHLHKMEISRYRGILEQYEKQADVKHDMKNHIISLRVLAEHEEWDKLREYLLKIYDAGRIGEEEIETGNNTVNAIINTKRRTAAQKNISFDCSVNISKPLMIDEFDLCIIWGNILDNAIKAAGDAEEKYIFIQAEIVKKNLLIQMKNSAPPDIRQGPFNKRNWGTGLRNVDRIVSRENGIMDIKAEGTVFEISILLPVVDWRQDRA